MAFIRSNNANLMKAGLDAILFEPWEKADPFKVINQVFNVGTHDSEFKRWMTIKGFPILTSKTEGAAYGSADASEAYYTDLKHVAYGVYTAITHEARLDERYSVINQFPAAMRDAAEATVHYYAAAVFGEGFATRPSYQTGNRTTAEYLFDADHDMKNGSTQANEPSTAADLTNTSLWAAVNAFYNFKTDAGLPYVISPKVLLIPHQLQQTAAELLKSQLMSENAENALNVLRTETNIEPVIWPYWLGNTSGGGSSGWYLLADKGKMGDKFPTQFVWREKPWTKMTVEDKTDNYLYYIYERFSCGWPDYIGAYGSPGA